MAPWTTFATPAELAKWTGQPAPCDAERQLERASELLADELLLTAVYDTDADGNPTDALVIAAFRDAVCAQVEFWGEVGEEADVSGPVQSVAIGGLQIAYGAGDNRASPETVAPRALRKLKSPRLAGRLTLGFVRTGCA